jgi:hypothetical protein
MQSSWHEADASRVRTWYSAAVRPTTARLLDPEMVPYFLWDTQQTVAEAHRILAGAAGPERDELLARLLREANARDVWLFTTSHTPSLQLESEWGGTGQGTHSVPHAVTSSSCTQRPSQSRVPLGQTPVQTAFRGTGSVCSSSSL